MGSGASNNQTTRLNSIHQLTTQNPLGQKSLQLQSQPGSFLSHSPSPLPRNMHTKPTKEGPKWPLPPAAFKEEFAPNWPSDLERYSNPKKIKVSDEKTGKSKEFHQKETSTNQWKIENSSIHDSAHVQSSLRTQSHACINLSTTQEINALLIRLSEVHSQLDLNIEERGKVISEQSKLIIDVIINDTRDMQQSLLTFAKKRQTVQDELYNEWLQMYVVELDQWKSARLAELQEELQTYQKKIMIQSQQLITEVNREMHQLRDELLKIEQVNASTTIQEIIERIQTMSTHQLGTETVTKINLIIHGNVGTKVAGQTSTFDFDQNDTNDDTNSGSKANQLTKQGFTKLNGGSSIQLVKTSTGVTTTTQQKKLIARTTTISENNNKDLGDYDDQ
ncbi:unnamed protein product [Rotaria sp. Silwood2]|nr:unnamed protein product [Rotaria sp. Silwood2]CAF3276765.1 unnamed protein product [Rotaria sp. Silwood2]CAF4111604.1 unnamed protein product [Rotaria sp. Silwood2]CAF4200941.1 unnamed protein product [Rotaria sp. Silwood2]